MHDAAFLKPTVPPDSVILDPILLICIMTDFSLKRMSWVAFNSGGRLTVLLVILVDSQVRTRPPPAEVDFGFTHLKTPGPVHLYLLEPTGAVRRAHGLPDMGRGPWGVMGDRRNGAGLAEDVILKVENEKIKS